jgi:hypothetical protein
MRSIKDPGSRVIGFRQDWYCHDNEIKDYGIRVEEEVIKNAKSFPIMWGVPLTEDLGVISLPGIYENKSYLYEGLFMVYSKLKKPETSNLIINSPSQFFTIIGEDKNNILRVITLLNLPLEEIVSA